MRRVFLGAWIVKITQMLHFEEKLCAHSFTFYTKGLLCVMSQVETVEVQNQKTQNEMHHFFFADFSHYHYQ